jgi:hypothetical protein
MKSWGIYIVAALGFAIYGAATDADRDGSGAIVGEGTVDAFSIRTGDCFDDSSSYEGEVDSLPGVPCSQPHDNETYAVFDVSESTYPEGDAMAELANNSCLERFESFAGIDYPSSTLEVMTLYPTAASWQQDDREVVCAVYDTNSGKLEGSVKGLAL